MSGRIEDLLGHGRNNAIPAQQLAELAGLRSVRQLQTAIAAEVELTGAPIVCASNGKGYYMAATRAELLDYERALTRRAGNTFKRLIAVRRALRECEGQFSFSEQEAEHEKSLQN